MPMILWSYSRRRRPTGRAIAVAALALLLFAVLLNLPVEPLSVGLGDVAWMPLELAVAVLALAILRPLRRARWLPPLVAVAMLLVVGLELAEAAARTALGRPVNLYLDIHLVPSIVDLLRGWLGDAAATGALLAVAVALVVLFVLSALAARALQWSLGHRGLRGVLGVAAVLCVAGYAGQRVVPDAFAGHRFVSAYASGLVDRQVGRWAATRQEEAAFREAAAVDPWETAPPGRLLDGLGGADVLVLFVESYGRSAVEDPRYGAVVGPTLAEFERTVQTAGLHAASAYLTSPTQGGQSWLAHGALLSGLWTDSQLRYDLLVTGDRRTLVGDFAAAGYRTIAIMPAITRPWPEAGFFGYRQTYFAADLDYAGPPFNWVTMPDQYTLSFLQRRERATADAPLFAEVALISSHAPWTPIAVLIPDWSSIGDGRVFERWADAGPAPEALWRDIDAVRRHYALSVRYSLDVIRSFAGNFVDDQTLLIVVGDHQPAPLITGEDASRDVPMHVVSGDPALIERFLALGFDAGIVPARRPALMRMDAFRDAFLGAFSTAAAPAI